MAPRNTPTPETGHARCLRWIDHLTPKIERYSGDSNAVSRTLGDLRRGIESGEEPLGGKPT